MRRIAARPVLLLTALALVLASCTGGDDAASTTSSTTLPVDTTATTQSPPVTTTPTTTTTTLPPSGPPIAIEGNENETVEAIQFALDCNGFGDLEIDGDYGPATRAAVEAAQTALGRAVDGGQIDEETFVALSRTCTEDRRLPGEDGGLTVVGNAAPDDPERFQIALTKDTLLTIVVPDEEAVAVTVHTDDGIVVPPNGDDTWSVETTMDHVIEVASDLEPITFALSITVAEGVAAIGDWILATDGITYRGTELGVGDDADAVIDDIFEFLGHGVRGAYDEFDTDWYVITEPQELGLRGIFIEGLAFLFYGPHPSDPDRPETLARIRFEGPSDDADGEPRPDDYVTTAEGITVGDTLADLKAAYGTGVKAGSNSEEHYYRYTDSGGELCFYFGASEPGDPDVIVEMATECRS